MLVFVTDPSREELEISGTVDVVVARVPAVLSTTKLGEWVDHALDLFADEPVWLGERANLTPPGSVLVFVVLNALQRREATHLWVERVDEVGVGVA